jgi:hypothetical protein
MSPFKRTISSLVLAVLLVGGAWYLSADDSLSSRKVAGDTKANYAVSDIDSDDDGLKDWEERLWRTDSKNPDTDGDGTSDGNEVATSRDPAVAGPNDSTKEVVLSRNRGIKAITEDKSLNVSEAISRAIFSSYLSTKTNAGASTNEAEALAILLAEKLPKSKNYTLSDLNISSANTKEAYKLYGNSLATALQSGDTSLESELTIFARAVETKDKQELKKLDVVIINLEGIISGALRAPVPVASAQLHLSLVNYFEAVKYDLSGMKLIFDDPTLAFLALNSYQTDTQKLLENLGALKKVVQESGAIFGSKEAGYKIFQ